MRKRKLLWHLFIPFLLVTVGSLLAIGWYTVWSLRAFYDRHLEADLRARATLLEAPVKRRLDAGDMNALDAFCKRMGERTDTRITIVVDGGKVVADSHHDPATMESHADRPEILQALKTGSGRKVRRSGTLKQRMMYFAIAPQWGRDRSVIIRTSLPVDSIDEALWQVTRGLLVAGVIVAGAAALVSLLISRRLTRPMREMERVAGDFARGQLHRRLPAQSTAETASLAEALNTMAQQLDERIRTITLQRNELEAVLGGMIEAVVAVDPDERIIRMNRAAGRLFGLDPANAQGRSVQEALRHSRLQRVVSEALSRESAAEEEIALRLGDEEVFLQAHAVRLADERGRVTGAVVVLNDVTRLKRLENVRREFVANVSHELRTPITSIKGFLETIREGVGDPDDAKRFMEITCRQVDRLNAIIEDLLRLSRIEQSEREGLSMAKARIRGVLAEALGLCESKAQARNVTVSLTCDEDLAADVNAPLIEQALVNLVDNAIKYSDPGGTVRVSGKKVDGELVISVADEGSGIPPEHLPRLFERFYRVDRARSRKLGGTGLGLAIVKHIAQAHGGTVSVASVPGKGSTFTIRVPQA